MDSDDVSHPSRLRMQLTYLEKTLDVVACGSRYRLIGDANGIVIPPIDHQACSAILNITGCIAHPTVMMRASVLKGNNLFYEDEFLYAEDYRLWSSLSQYGKLENLKEVLFDYRIHKQQITQTKIRLQRKAQAEIASAHMARDEIGR